MKILVVKLFDGLLSFFGRGKLHESKPAGFAGGGGVALGAPVGPPGGNVGNLMVGAADGFGGKLMRTVSFLGWTLPVSFLAGGTAPAGAPGMFCGISAIVLVVQDRRPMAAVKFNSERKPSTN